MARRPRGCPEASVARRINVNRHVEQARFRVNGGAAENVASAPALDEKQVYERSLPAPRIGKPRRERGISSGACRQVRRAREHASGASGDAPDG